MSLAPLGILAGRGDYPKLLLQNIKRTGRAVVVAGLAGQSDAGAYSDADAFDTVPIGAIRRTARFFENHRVGDIYFAGGVQREGALRYLRPDNVGVRLMVDALFRGDDSLLRKTADAFEKLGLTVADPAPFLTSLLAARGVLAGPPPNQGILSDLRIGFEVAKRHGAADRGQAVVVRNGHIIAVEGRAGTDHLIRNVDEAGAVVVKTVKPGQDRRFDLPAIGPATLDACGSNGHIAAIGVEAGGVLILRKTSVAGRCAANGISLVGLRSGRII